MLTVVMTDKQDTQSPSPTVTDAVDRVRDLINEPRTHAKVSRQRASFNVLCSCLDAIGDTQLGIDCYPLNSPERGDGRLYLMLYGILQVLYVQQDALSNMASCLGLPYKRDPLLSELRRVRNVAVGHPTKTHDGAAHFIVRISMSARGFDLMTLPADGREPRFQSISIPELIENQRRSARDTLLSIATHLEHQDRQHRALHMDNKLAAIFAPTLSYDFQKVFEATQRSELHPLGKVHVEQILDVLAKFKQALVIRQVLDAYEGVTTSLDEVEWPLQRLRSYFEGEKGELVSRSAYIFATFCKGRVEELREVAIEIDKEYASSDTGSTES